MNQLVKALWFCWHIAIMVKSSKLVMLVFYSQETNKCETNFKAPIYRIVSLYSTEQYSTGKPIRNHSVFDPFVYFMMFSTIADSIFSPFFSICMQRRVSWALVIIANAHKYKLISIPGYISVHCTGLVQAGWHHLWKLSDSYSLWHHTQNLVCGRCLPL